MAPRSEERSNSPAADSLPPGISVVVPVYNSESSLEPLVSRIEAVLSRLGTAFEVILVNDGSRDRSWGVLETLRTKHAFVRPIDLMRNYGQHNALLCGIRHARFATVVTLDDDLQNPPEEIPSLLSRLAEGFDVVYGTPQNETHGFLRDMASVVTKLALQTAMGSETARKVSAFRALRTDVRDAFRRFEGPYVSIDVLLTWATSRFTAVGVRQDQRVLGVSNYSVRKLITHAFNMMTGFSTLPLRIGSLLGFGFVLFGFGILVYVVSRYLLFGSTVAGFPFLASTVAIFSGVQLFVLGLIGEYLARMHFRIMDKPSYTVRHQDSPGDEPPASEAIPAESSV
jgi:glycosyltransferase involved in cell wall biosynthesis